jgi:glycosyltransferase involved in cell wall biosynthesis
MRILFFIDALSAGGKERRLIELMKELKIRPDIEFELVVMSKSIQYAEIFNLNVKVHYLIRKTKRDISIFHKIYKLCKIYKPDLIHCWDSMTAVYLAPISKMLKIKFVNGMVVDAPQKRNILNRNWLRAKLTFPFSSVIIGNSFAGLTAYSAPKNKSVCIHNGFNFNRTENIDDDRIIRKQLDITTKYIVGMVASFSIYKDYATYYASAQLLLKKRNDITFLAIGNDTDSDSSWKLIDDQYKKHFKLLGRKSGIESFINAMDICVLSTFTEGISNSILEYMSLGKPVIATTGGGTNEIVEDQKTGFLIKTSNPEELAEKIEMLLNDAELREKMGMAGLQRIKSFFSINRMVNEFIMNYKKLVIK